jgi:hypothetical protein
MSAYLKSRGYCQGPQVFGPALWLVKVVVNELRGESDRGKAKSDRLMVILPQICNVTNTTSRLVSQMYAYFSRNFCS